MAHNPMDKIQALDAIEKEILTCLQSAGLFKFFDIHTNLYISLLIEPPPPSIY